MIRQDITCGDRIGHIHEKITLADGRKILLSIQDNTAYDDGISISIKDNSKTEDINNILKAKVFQK